MNIVGQPNEYWKNGSLWIHSGTHAGKSAAGKVRMLAIPRLFHVGSAIAARSAFSGTGIFPWRQVMGAIRRR